MKMTIEVDLQWVDEDGNLDDAIQDQVVNRIESQISDQAKEKITLAVAERVDSLVDERLNTMLESWMSEDTEVTDKWGKVVFEGSILNLLKKRFDEFWQQTVDMSGRSSNGYGDKHTRIDWIIGERIKIHCEKFAVAMEKQFTEEVEQQVSSALKQAVGNKIVDTLGVPEMVASIRKALPAKSKGDER